MLRTAISRGFPRLALLTSLCAAARPVHSQDLHLGAGYSSYDLSGTGSTWVLAAHYTHRLAGPLHAEIGATIFHYDTQFSQATTYLFPEASAVLKPTRGRVRPYLAAGAGVNVAFAGFGGGELTLHGAGGLDVLMSARWGLRGEFRARAVDPFGAVTADLTLGPTVRL